MGTIRVGTSGYTYGHWRGVFYPEGLPNKDLLKFYAQSFDTVEINSSFYRLPKATTFLSWYAQTPKGFLFSLKASRFITHIKKLKDSQQPWELFLKRAKNLREKLGPILFQFPPLWKKNLERLERFIQCIPKDLKATVEFRHPSWFSEEIYALLKKQNVALTIADTPEYPMEERLTADFIYLRFHGHRKLYVSNYSEKELQSWARKIRRWRKSGKSVYAYFDNDAFGRAVKNALRLKDLCR